MKVTKRNADKGKKKFLNERGDMANTDSEKSDEEGKETILLHRKKPRIETGNRGITEADFDTLVGKIYLS